MLGTNQVECRLDAVEAERHLDNDALLALPLLLLETHPAHRQQQQQHHPAHRHLPQLDLSHLLSQHLQLPTSKLVLVHGVFHQVGDQGADQGKG